MGNRLKAALIGPVFPYRGGIAHFTTCLARAMDDSADCEVISFRRLYPRQLYPGASDHDPSRQSLRVEAEYKLDSLNPLSWLAAGQRISRMKPGIAIFQWWTTFLAPCYLTIMRTLRHHRVQILLIVHNVLPHEARFFDPWLTRAVFSSVDGLILLSERERVRLMNFMPSLQNAHVYPHPPYEIFAGERIPREQAKKRLGVPPDRPLVLFFGFVRPYKGVPTLIEGLELLLKRGLALHLAIAGEIWGDRSDIERLIEEKGLRGDVLVDNRYIPNEEVNLYFSAADVFVAPYLRGTQSGAANIALGYDLPIVATTQIANSLTGIDSDRLWSVTPGDAHALAEAIEESLQANTRARAARFQGEKPPSWEGLAEFILSLARNDS